MHNSEVFVCPKYVPRLELVKWDHVELYETTTDGKGMVPESAHCRLRNIAPSEQKQVFSVARK
jgi:hypothetical protein